MAKMYRKGREKKKTYATMTKTDSKTGVTHGPSGGNIDEMEFGKAFKHWKEKGVDTFTWRGKKYTTKHKGE